MKLLYITNGITGAGGLERVLSVKASALAEDFGYEVHILTLNEERKDPFYQFTPQIVFHNIEAEGSPLDYIRSYRKGMTAVIKTIAPDIISVCDDGLKGMFIPNFISSRIPVVYESHASQRIGDKGKGMSVIKKLQHRLKQVLARNFKRVVVLTPGNLKEWPGNNTVVIPNPVSFYPAEPATLFNYKVIAVGSHSYNKGYDRLLNIWKQVEAQCSSWTLEIYGKSANGTYEKMAQELQLQRVNFHPPYPQIQEKYLESSVFVLPSRSEGFGMVIIEAMACGVPVVSFDCPHGPADIISEGEDGFLIENENTGEFSARLLQLMKERDLRVEMGTTAREHVKRYLPESIVLQWDQLFRNLTGAAK